MKRALALAVLTSLYLLHFDFWLWQRSDLVAGLPVGLLYHFVYCFVVSAALAFLIRAWRLHDVSAD